jgi:hypothetical protein
VPRCYKHGIKSVVSQTRVEVASNTSTVTLRVVGGDENGSLESETVKYGHESKGLGPEKHYSGEGHQHIQKTDPSSRQRGRPRKQDCNCERVINNLGLDTKTYCLTDRQSQCELSASSARDAVKIEPERVKLKNIHC